MRKFYIRSRRIKRLVWNAGILLFWYRSWIRENEFDISLIRDGQAYVVMSEKRKEKGVVFK